MALIGVDEDKVVPTCIPGVRFLKAPAISAK